MVTCVQMCHCRYMQSTLTDGWTCDWVHMHTGTVKYGPHHIYLCLVKVRLHTQFQLILDLTLLRLHPFLVVSLVKINLIYCLEVP